MRIRTLSELATFAIDVVRAFHRNQGLLLAGAVAYYALLSLLPLLTLSVIGLSQLVDREVLLGVLQAYLGWLLPGLSDALLGDIGSFLDHRRSIGFVLLATLFFFSSLAFSVLEKAMASIFSARPAAHSRHFLVAFLLPYGCVLLLGGALFGLTVVSVLTTMMAGASHLLSQGIGLVAATLVLSAFYLLIPPGRTHPGHALLGGAVAALLWEGMRHALIWYFANLSKIGLVYGSLSGAVMLLLVMELAATLLLFGAQVIAEYERRPR